MKLIFGPFTDEFESLPNATYDTLSFKGAEARAMVELDHDSTSPIRGIFLGYRSFIKEDTVVNATRVEFLEEQIQ
jgi:hypothetical protein